MKRMSYNMDQQLDAGGGDEDIFPLQKKRTHIVIN